MIKPVSEAGKIKEDLEKKGLVKRMDTKADLKIMEDMNNHLEKVRRDFLERIDKVDKLKGASLRCIRG